MSPMKRILVGASEEELLSTIEVILKHWGYRVTVSSQAEQVDTLLDEIPFDLVIFGSRLLSSSDALHGTLSKRVKGGMPFVLLQRDSEIFPFSLPHFSLSVPINVFELFALIQKHLEKQPRQNLRLTVKLPGMFNTGGGNSLTEVLSLSTRGLFIKTGAKMEEGATVRITIPLLGMKRELEIESRILYRVEPIAANNYSQGYGIEFTSLNSESETLLKRYIETTFFGEIAGKTWGRVDMTWEQLTALPRELGLFLVQTT